MGIFGANYGLNYDTSPDTTNPTITISSPLDTATVAPNFTVSGTASDDVALSVIEVRVDSDSYQTATGLENWTISLAGLTDGSHTITARATDTSSNEGTDSITVTVDQSLLGGSAGGKVKSVGRSLTNPPLGNRPKRKLTGVSEARLITKTMAKSKSKLLVSSITNSEAEIKSIWLGSSSSSIMRPVKAESVAGIRRISAAKSFGRLDLTPRIADIIRTQKTINRNTERMAVHTIQSNATLSTNIEKLTKLMKLKALLDSIQ